MYMYKKNLNRTVKAAHSFPGDFQYRDAAKVMRLFQLHLKKSNNKIVYKICCNQLYFLDRYTFEIFIF